MKNIPTIDLEIVKVKSPEYTISINKSDIPITDQAPEGFGLEMKVGDGSGFRVPWGEYKAGPVDVPPQSVKTFINDFFTRARSSKRLKIVIVNPQDDRYDDCGLSVRRDPGVKFGEVYLASEFWQNDPSL